MQAIQLHNTDTMTREQWLSHRQLGIGGSDAAAACGISKWKSMLDLYNEKVTGIDDSTQSEAAYFGNILEDIVRQEFVTRKGITINQNPYILQHPEHEFMLANIDGEGVDEDGTPFILECKTANAYSLPEWEEGIPINYKLQVLHYLAVTGLRRAYVIALVGGQKIFIHRMDATQEEIDELIQREQIFWDMVTNRNVPSNIEPDRQFTETVDDVIDLTIENEDGSLWDIDNLLDNIKKIKAEIKDKETHLKVLQNNIKGALGEHTTGITNEHKISWKPVVTKRFDAKRFKVDHRVLYDEYTKSSSYRKLTIKRIS